MQRASLGCLCVLLLLWCEAQAEAGGEPPGAVFALVLQQAAKTPGSPYLLQVNCTGQKGVRSLRLFPGGAAVWNRSSQIMLPASTRSALLETLLERDFPAFEASYGGYEQPDKSAAPARVTCRIMVEIQQMQKSSVQMAGGKQSARFLHLAANLLDQAERYANSAVTPLDLKDALDKLYAGQLAPQILNLRFMELPARNSSEPGFILHIAGGQVTRQEYAPGHALTEAAAGSLEHDQYIRLIAAMRTAQIDSFPANLWSDKQLELEVQVLANKKVILARRFSRLESTQNTPEQQRFENLLMVLRELEY